MSFEEYLRINGFHERAINCECPHCVTVADFLKTHPYGNFILICQNMVIPVSAGECFDSLKSLDEIVLYYFEGESINVSC